MSDFAPRCAGSTAADPASVTTVLPACDAAADPAGLAANDSVSSTAADPAAASGVDPGVGEAGPGVSDADAAGITIADANAREDRRRKALQAMFGSNFGRAFVSPFMVIEDHVIACPVAIRFYKKDFQYLSRQLYLEYQYRAWRGFDKALLDRYAAISTAKLTAIDALMQNNINRLHKLLEQQGHQADLTLWPNAHVTDVPIIATQARTYLGVLTRMDRVYTLSGTANLLGVIDSTQRAEVELSSKKAVRAFRSVLQNEVAALYREAERIMGQQHRSDKVDPGMQAVVHAQDEAIAPFDESVPPEREEDVPSDQPAAAAAA